MTGMMNKWTVNYRSDRRILSAYFECACIRACACISIRNVVFPSTDAEIILEYEMYFSAKCTYRTVYDRANTEYISQ